MQTYQMPLLRQPSAQGQLLLHQSVISQPNAELSDPAQSPQTAVRDQRYKGETAPVR